MRMNCIIIWYSEHQKKYFINTQDELALAETGYIEENDTVLYTMESKQLRLATKIKNRLNEARELVPVE